MHEHFVSKPDGDLASRTFQHYAYPLAKAFGESVDDLSTHFLGAGIIGREKCEQVQLSHQTAMQKGNLLLAAVAARFEIDGGEKTLRKVCKIIAKHQHLKKLATKIQKKYGMSCSTLVYMC